MRCVRGGACDFRIEISDPPPDPMIFQSRCPSCFFFFLVAQHRVVIKCSARAGLSVPRAPSCCRWCKLYEMSLIESNVRVDDRFKHQSCHPFDRGSVAGVTTVCVRAADDQGPYALTAAELASIESSKTREKLKTKADHVRMNSEVHFNKVLCTRCTVGSETLDGTLSAQRSATRTACSRTWTSITRAKDSL